MKKAKQPILYVACSLSSVLFEYLVVFLLEFFFGAWMGEFAQKIIGRILSSLLNFNLNFRFVFPRDESYGRSMMKYYCLAIPVMFISAALLDLVAKWVRIDELTAGYSRFVAAVLHTLINLPVDVAIMFCNFLIQKFWVFAKKRK